MIRCRRRFGRYPCGHALEYVVDRAGNVAAVCPACARYAAGLCLHCPRPRDGQRRRCDACQHQLHLVRGRRFRRLYPERQRAADRRWREKNPEYKRAYMRTWRATHREQKRALDRASRQRRKVAA